MKRRRVKETETTSKQSETGSAIFVYANLPLVHPKLSVQHSFTVQQLKQLGVANISVHIAKSSTQFAGRLALFRENWERLCSDRWVLSAIQGYQIDWTSHPRQAHEPACHHFSKDETESLESEIQTMLGKGAISLVANHRDGFLSTIFLVPKKDGGHRPIINLKRVNQFIPHHHFKMEGIHMLKDLLKQGDFMAKIDVKDAYFAVPISEPDRKYLRFRWRNIIYQFNCLPFGLSCAPWVFTKITKAATAVLREMGIRLIVYIDDMLVMAESETLLKDHIAGTVYLLEYGVRDQLPQINITASEDDGVPRLSGELNHNGAQAPREQDEEHQTRGKQDPRIQGGHGTGSVVDSRKYERSDEGDSYSPTVLSTAASGAPTSLGDLVSSLQHNPLPIGRGEGGASVVDHPLQELERAEPDCQETERLTRDGCIPHGMGGCLPRNQDRWPLVEGGAETPHQLSGITGSIPCLQVLLQKQEKHSCVAENGQHISDSLHQQDGRDGVPSTKQIEQRILAMVHGEGHLRASTTPGREAERNSRRGVQGDERQVRLDALPKDLSKHQLQAGSSGSGLICIEADNPTPDICELETGPGGDGHGCLHDRLGRPEGLCQPTMEYCGQGTCTDPTTESGLGPDSTSLEIPNLVPSTAGNVHRHSEDHTGESRPHPTDTSTVNAGCASPASRVEYLRRQYKEQKLSEKAAELMLSSWREKSSRSYESQFQKWISWCSTRSVNLISCRVSEVVNFLADLFSQGYQYRSLNAYRSAISSVHDKIDGQDVGQHPLVTRLLKGAFHQRPPQPRYTQTWDVGIVTTYIRSIGENKSLSLQELSHKLTMLMALTRPSRSADLAQLDLSRRTYSVEGVTFQPTALSKQSRQQKHGTEFHFPCYPQDERLCPVATLREYESHTKPLRGSYTTLFVGISKPHKPVCSSTIARWLKSLLEKSRCRHRNL